MAIEKTSTARPRRQLVALAVAAAELDVSTKTLRRRIADGTLPAFRIGASVKVDRADLDRLLEPMNAAAREAVSG